MRGTGGNIFWLGTKELRAFAHDYVLVILVLWAFSFSIVNVANSGVEDLHNASVGIIDEDHSVLSRRISGALLPPYFNPPLAIGEGSVDHLMNNGRITFAIDIPPDFERDLRRKGLSVDQMIADLVAAHPDQALGHRHWQGPAIRHCRQHRLAGLEAVDGPLQHGVGEAGIIVGAGGLHGDLAAVLDQGAGHGFRELRALGDRHLAHRTAETDDLGQVPVAEDR